MKQSRRTANLSYEEAVSQVRDVDIITIHYDGVCKKGHWYDDHMLKMFSECRLLKLTSTEFQVMEWPEKQTQRKTS